MKIDVTLLFLIVKYIEGAPNIFSNIMHKKKEIMKIWQNQCLD